VARSTAVGKLLVDLHRHQRIAFRAASPGMATAAVATAAGVGRQPPAVLRRPGQAAMACRCRYNLTEEMEEGL